VEGAAGLGNGVAAFLDAPTGAGASEVVLSPKDALDDCSSSMKLRPVADGCRVQLGYDLNSSPEAGSGPEESELEAIKGLTISPLKAEGDLSPAKTAAPAAGNPAEARSAGTRPPAAKRLASGPHAAGSNKPGVRPRWQL
jgi:hypothetical protein